MSSVKSAPLGLRVAPRIKWTLGVAARREHRSRANMVEWLVLDCCQRAGSAFRNGTNLRSRKRMDERTFMALLDAAAVERERIFAQGSRFRIEIDAPGRSFTIETGRGALRLWPTRVSAAKWLKSIGVAEASLDLRYWTPGQRDLPI